MFTVLRRTVLSSSGFHSFTPTHASTHFTIPSLPQFPMPSLSHSFIHASLLLTCLFCCCCCCFSSLAWLAGWLASPSLPSSLACWNKRFPAKGRFFLFGGQRSRIREPLCCSHLCASPFIFSLFFFFFRFLFIAWPFTG